jgi:hypothetical protein
MKLKVYQEKKSEEEKEVYLRLFQHNNVIILKAVNHQGLPHPGGCLLEINNQGKIYRNRSVSPYLGFKLDGEGRIAVS